MWNYLQVVLTSISLLISSTKLTVQSHLRKFSSHTSTDGGAGLSEKTSTSRLAPAEGVEFRLSRSVKGCVVPWERNISKHNLLCLFLIVVRLVVYRHHNVITGRHSSWSLAVKTSEHENVNTWSLESWLALYYYSEYPLTIIHGVVLIMNK